MEYSEENFAAIAETAKNAKRDKKGKTTTGKIVRGGQKTLAAAAGTSAGTAAAAATTAALSAGATGAAVGSAVPVVGTIVGAVVGAAVVYVSVKYADEINRTVNRIIGKKEPAEKTGFQLYELYLAYVSNNPDEKQRLIDLFNKADKKKIDDTVKGLKFAAVNPAVAEFYMYFFIGVKLYLWKNLTNKGKENALYFWNKLSGQNVKMSALESGIYTTSEGGVFDLIL